jgi:hypothetical protein
MPRNVSITFVTTTAVLPPGVSQGVSAAYVVSILTNATPPVLVTSQNLPAGTLTALFTSVANGSYIAEAQALDSNGSLLGTPADTPFTVIDLLFNQPTAPLAVVVT